MQTLIGFKKNYSKQFFFFGACIVVAIFILLTDSKFFTATSNISYLIGIVLILATFVVGKEIKGSKSWIPLGFMNLQPVELCKIFTALALAKYLSMPETDFKKPKSQMIAAAIAFTPAVLSISAGRNRSGAGLFFIFNSHVPGGFATRIFNCWCFHGSTAGCVTYCSAHQHSADCICSFCRTGFLF